MERPRRGDPRRGNARRGTAAIVQVTLRFGELLICAIMKNEQELPTLEELIRASGLKKIHIAEQMGIRREWLYKKGQKPGEWKVGEIERLSRLLGHPPEIIFAVLHQQYATEVSQEGNARPKEKHDG